MARGCDPPADPAALRPSAGRALVVDLSFGAGLTCVPALSGHPFWLVAPCVAVAGLIVAVAGRDGRRVAVLLAYLAPVAWSAPCLAAGAVWLLGSRPRAVWRTATGPVRPVHIGAWVAIGLAAGAAVVGLDRRRILQEGFLFAVRMPPRPVLVAAVVGIAVVNAVSEELLWRGLLDRLTITASARFRYLLQGASFGLAHWNGIPYGGPGVLASGTYSMLLYWIGRARGSSGASRCTS